MQGCGRGGGRNYATRKKKTSSGTLSDEEEKGEGRERKQRRYPGKKRGALAGMKEEPWGKKKSFVHQTGGENAQRETNGGSSARAGSNVADQVFAGGRGTPNGT